MSMRAALSGAALVGAGVTLFGCGTPPPTPAPATTPVQDAWDNHFSAFAMGADQMGAEALDKIMLDYDEDSVIAVFNDHCAGNTITDKRDGYMEYKTLPEIRQFFSDLFAQLGSLGAVNTIGPLVGQDPSVVVMEGDLPMGNVFLTWRTNLTGSDAITYATDTFSWQMKGMKAMILKQNIVTTEEGKTCEDTDVGEDKCAMMADDTTCAGWANHFEAFGMGAGAAGNMTTVEAALDKIMLDYTDDSIVQVFDNRGEEYSKFTGTGEIRGMFNTLFADITAAADGDGNIGLAVKLLEVEPQVNGVFLVWESFSHPKATDTFVFDDAGKIIRQNIVAMTKEMLGLKVQV